MNKRNHQLLASILICFLGFQLNAQQFFFSAVRPLSCSSADGILTIVPTRGVPPFTYQWSTGDTEVSASGLVKGQYSATLTDATGATVVHTHYLNSEEFDLSLTGSLPVGFCNPNSGKLEVTPSGGVAPYSYLWSNGQTNATATGLGLGNYTVTIQDATGCVAVGEYEVKPVHNFYSPYVKIQVTEKPDCQNPTNGELVANMQGSGYGPYTYAWNNGANTSINGNLAIGNYRVTITDALGCSATSTANVRQKMTTTGSVVCTGASSGTASAVLDNATTPVNYQWSTGETTQSIANLANGVYNVTATDVNGCSAVEQVAVKVPGLQLSDNSYKCFTGNNGFGYVWVSNDQAVSFLWDNGVTSSWNNTLSAGSHSVTVTTALGCTLNGNLVIAQPQAPGIDIQATTTAADCSNSQGGALNLNISGGIQPFNYNVYGPGGFFTSDLSTLQNLKAGNYSVQVSSTAGNCWAFESFNIPDAGGFEPEVIVDEIDCTTGFGSIAIAGVTTPGAMYEWENGATGPALFNLTEGCYKVTVTAGGSCVEYFQPCLYKEDSIQQNNPCSGLASGRIINDLGQAGCTGTNGIPFQIIRTQPSGALNFSDATGTFNVYLPDGTFDLEVPQYDPMDIACPPNARHTVVSMVGTDVFGLDFHFLNSNNTDHRVTQQALRTAQPGYPYSIRVKVCNDGATVNPGTLDLTYGNFLGQVTGNNFGQHSVFTFNGESQGTPDNTANFSFPGITSGGCELLQFDMITPTVTPAGSSFITMAQVSPNSGDPTPANNISTLYNTVMGSFDPNAVLAYPARNGNPKDGGEIIRNQDKSLSYQIFFQNTGNAAADLVVVKDTIDPSLDLASIRNITASHDMKITTEENNSILVFTFENINLIDSTSDYANSIGSIQYDIDLKPGLALGTEIKKTAAIFFDFNTPVITNQNILEIVSASPVRNLTKSGGLITFPNPADAYTAIYCDAAGVLRMYSAMGSLLMTKDLGDGLQKIDTAELPAGVYMISFESNGNTTTGRILVQH
ncbi:MAG: T9SS type A sorting domain-containing protein [Saprospiraceae bacterium]